MLQVSFQLSFFFFFLSSQNLRNHDPARDSAQTLLRGGFLIVELWLHGERKGARPPRSERILLVTGRNININDILPGRAVMRANFVSAPLIYERYASLCAVICKVNSLSADLVRTEAADNRERPGCDLCVNIWIFTSSWITESANWFHLTNVIRILE